MVSVRWRIRSVRCGRAKSSDTSAVDSAFRKAENMSNLTPMVLCRFVLTCVSVVVTTRPSTVQAQPGPRSEIAFTLSYADLAAELDADAFGFGLGDVEAFTGTSDGSGSEAAARHTRRYLRE